MPSPAQLAIYFVVSATAAIFCIIAVWAVTSRRHWLIRASMPLLALAVLLPVQAHEPLLYCAMVMGEMVGLIFAARGVLRLWKARPSMAESPEANPERRPSALLEYFPTFFQATANLLRNDDRQSLVPPSRSVRFGLRDLMLAMVPVAFSAWIISQFAGVSLLMEWPDVLYASLWLAIIALLAWRIFASRWKWLMTVLFVLAVVTAAFVDAELLGDWLFASEAIAVQKSLARFGFVGGRTVLVQTLALYVATAICILTGLAILAVFHSERRRAVSRLIAVSALIFPSALLAYIYWQMLGAVEIPATPSLPDNVYPQVLSVAQRLEKADSKQVAAIHDEVLKLLARPGYVEVDWSRAAADPAMANDFSLIVHYLNLARSLQVTAENLHAAGKHDEAALYDLAILKLGAQHLRGGLVIHALTGIGVEGVGTWLVAKHRSDYSPEIRRQIIANLVRLEPLREPASVTLARDRAFENLAWRWRNRLQWAIDRLLDRNSVQGKPGPQQHHAALKRHEADEQLVLAELAIGLFHEDHGRWPARLEELVPDYLPEVPRDLHGSGPLIYRVTESGFILYSVSHDGRDDGGKFGTRIQSMGAGFDLNVDTIAR